MLILVAGAWLGAVPASASGEEDESAKSDVTIDQSFLDDQANIDLGKEIWDGQCTYCHGTKAYPGKAPKLKPHLYVPAFVYDRVAEGFRGMPPWKEVYTDEEIKSVVAYVLSRRFAP